MIFLQSPPELIRIHQGIFSISHFSSVAFLLLNLIISVTCTFTGHWVRNCHWIFCSFHYKPGITLAINKRSFFECIWWQDHVRWFCSTTMQPPLQMVSKPHDPILHHKDGSVAVAFGHSMQLWVLLQGKLFIRVWQLSPLVLEKWKGFIQTISLILFFFLIGYHWSDSQLWQSMLWVQRQLARFSY